MTELRGQGLLLRMTVARLHQKFGVTRDAVVIKSSPPCDGPQLLSGLCTTYDADLDRTRMEKGSLTWPEMPKLLYRHLPDQVAGEVLGLRWTSKGLWITALVDHEEARRCNAFSVCCTVERFEIIDPTSPSFVASVTKGVLTEVSLVPNPCNQFALVTERKTWRPSPMAQWADLMIRRVNICREMLNVLGSIQVANERTPPRSRSSFSTMVDQLHSTEGETS